MIKLPFKNKKEVSYFLGYEYDMTDSEDLHKKLAKSRIDKSTAEQLESSMKLVFKNGILTEMYSIEEGEYTEEEINHNGQPLTYRDYPLCNFRTLAFDKNGMHQIGGNPPSDFIFPDNNTSTPYVYLGYLSNKDPNLNWLSIELLHLVCPIYSNMGVLYLDYSNSNSPKLITKEANKIIGTEYDGLTSENLVEFSAYKASLRKHKLEIFYNGENIGNVGAPIFMQQSFIPKCPISGNEMQFLIQLESSDRIVLSRTDIKLKDEYLRRYFEKLDFWGAGILYIFIEPTTKVIALFIQNT